jgi:hypothetical protein
VTFDDTGIGREMILKCRSKDVKRIEVAGEDTAAGFGVTQNGFFLTMCLYSIECNAVGIIAISKAGISCNFSFLATL